MLTFKLANTINDYIDAWSIVYERYLMLELIDPNPFGLWVFPEYLSEKSFTVLAYEDESPIATVSGLWSKKLPLDEYYPKELNRLRCKKGFIVEGGLFAKKNNNISHSYVTKMLDVFFALLYNSIDLSQVVLGLHPRVSHIYENRYNFKVIGVDKIYTILNDAPVRLIHSDLSKLKKSIKINENQYLNFENRLILNKYIIRKEFSSNVLLNQFFNQTNKI